MTHGLTEGVVKFYAVNAFLMCVLLFGMGLQSSWSQDDDLPHVIESETRIPETEIDLSEELHGHLNDVYLPLQTEGVGTERTPPLFELGDPFLGTGPISEGFRIPTGAYWQPNLTVWGVYRTAFQGFDNGTPGSQRTEWANRLDLFGQLKLTGSERIVAGFRPFDDDGQFSGYQFHPSDDWVDGLDEELSLLFFEGELGEIFPNLDITDGSLTDIQFSVGRQPIIYQDGMLAFDVIDAIGFAKHNIQTPFDGNMQASFTYGWGDVHRNNNRRDSDADLFGLYTVTDFPDTVIEADIVYVESDDIDDDLLAMGISASQRIGPLNSIFRILHSEALEDETPASSSGTLLFSELSWTPPATYNILYWDLYYAIDQFASAARGPANGGPLGRTGILHAAVGLGSYQSPISNRSNDAVGSSVGYQMFFDHQRKHLTLEVGGREGVNNNNESIAAIGAQYQQAIGTRAVVRFDVFGSIQDNADEGWGLRSEFQWKF